MSDTSRSDDTVAWALIGTAAAVLLLHVFRAILWPFAFALVITVLIQAFLRAVVSVWPRANKRAVALIAGVAALGLLFAAGGVVLPGVAGLRDELPLLLERLNGLLTAVSHRVGLEEPLTVDVLFGNLNAREVASWMLGGLSSAFSGLVLTALFVIFQLVSWELIGRRLRLALGGREGQSTLVLERSVRGVETYLWIQTVTGLMNAGASGLIMFSVGLDHWVLWAIAFFMLSFIPFLGVAIGSIGPALFALLQFSSPWPSAIIFVGIQAVAFVVGNLVLPKLQASTQNIDPCASLMAVGAWSIVWGLPGAFLAVPLTLALIYQLAGTRRLRWVAILLSNDGEPLPETP
ncbi:AI-2E family transporter [Phenylobacterium sp.]|uniref:AI-2E family transporter n=1 Tax=Phenylobacterium sp. TaxID=1871053 RepID=UPI002F41A989